MSRRPRSCLIAAATWALGACSQGGAAPGGDAGAPDAGAADAGALLAGAPATLAISDDSGAGLGRFDPSPAWDPGADAGLLAYSVVAPDQAHVHTRLARSADRGASWRFFAEANQAGPLTIDSSDPGVCGASSCSGTLVHEVPSLLVDPGDSAERRYKLFTHAYFADAAGGLHYQLGYLSLATASDPAGPWSETKLIGWPSASSLSSQGAAQDLSSDAELAGISGCVALTEPGALLHGGELDLALGCVRLVNGAGAIEIELLRSTDHARSFAFVSTLLSAADAAALGSDAPQINAADLFDWNGSTWLFATPSGPVSFSTGAADGYRGCLLLQLGDLDAGTLLRDESGAPGVLARFTGGAAQFIGACAFDADLPGLGVAGDRLDTASSAPFTIFVIH